MKRFCLRQMRREYRGMLRACVGTAVVFLLCFALIGAISAANHVDAKAIRILLGIEGFIALLSLGAYLLLSDTDWLIKKTPFGQAMTQLGDAPKIMAEIDRAAEAFCEHHGSFILLRGWLVLLQPDGWQMEPFRVCARPIRRESVREIRLLQDQDPEDPQKRHGRLRWDAGETDFYLYQQQDVDALRQWMQEGGGSIDE